MNTEQDFKTIIFGTYTGIGIVILVIASFLSAISGSVITFISAIFFLGLGLAYNDYFVVPAKPPHRGVVTRRGKRLESFSLDEQWGFIPIKGILFDVINVNVERKTLSDETGKEPKVVTRTPDKAQNEVYYDIAFTPHTNYLINYLNSGGYKGIINQFKSEAGEQIREWAEGDEEGPRTWHELYKAKTAAINILIKRIATKHEMDKMAPIPDYAQAVPTQIWLKFFSKPNRLKLVRGGRSWPNEEFFENEKDWKKNNWEKVRKVLEKIGYEYIKIQKYNSEYRKSLIEDFQSGKAQLIEHKVEALKRKVAKRRSLIEDLRSGDADILIEDLGIKLERLNISNVEVIGAVKEAADQEAKEEQEREAEKLENAHVQDMVSSWDGKEVEGEDGKKRKRPKLSAEEAAKIIQTERNKITREIDEKHISLGDSAVKTLPKINLINLLGGNNNE